MPLGYYLGILQGKGAPGLWLGLIFGLLVAAVLLTWRFWRLSHHYQATHIQSE
jgi:MATE family multidrug resistance protein